MSTFHHSNRELSEDVARAELGLAPLPHEVRQSTFEGDLGDFEYANGAGLPVPRPTVGIPDTPEGFNEEPPTPPAA